VRLSCLQDQFRSGARAVQRLEPAEQVALARRVGWRNCTQLGRCDVAHLHGRHFCLRLGREEEAALARKLAAVAVELPSAESSCWAGLRVNGASATVQEDERFWPTLLMFCATRPRPDASWDEAGTLEFMVCLPAKWRRLQGAVRLQAAARGLIARMRVARATGRYTRQKSSITAVAGDRPA
jgi:hypothetical protein